MGNSKNQISNSKSLRHYSEYDQGFRYVTNNYQSTFQDKIGNGNLIPNRLKQPKYDLERRTAQFAADCRAFVRRIEKDIPNIEDAKQLVRSSGSIAANYLEANDCLGEKDKIMKLKISRREAKESRLWLTLFHSRQQDVLVERERLSNEATELIRILSTIISKLE